MDLTPGFIVIMITVSEKKKKKEILYGRKNKYLGSERTDFHTPKPCLDHIAKSTLKSEHPFWIFVLRLLDMNIASNITTTNEDNF